MSCRSLHRMNTRKSCHGFSIAMFEYYTLNALEIRLDISSTEWLGLSLLYVSILWKEWVVDAIL